MLVISSSIELAKSLEKKRGTYLAQSVLAWEPRAVDALHQACRSVRVVRCDHAHVPAGFLHHHAEEESAVDAVLLGALIDGGLDVGDVGLSVAGR